MTTHDPLSRVPSVRDSSSERKGQVYVLLSAILWSLFPVITILTFTNLSPLFASSVSTLVAAAFFAADRAENRGIGRPAASELDGQ